MVPANTLLPVFALLRILGAAFQNWGVHKLLSARLLLRLSECFLHESMQKTYIFLPYHFSCFDCDLIARHPYSLLSCPPIEVHRRRNTAFITVLVVETDDCTAVFLIGASNALHACNAYNLIGRCTAERALPALRINVCFHFSVPLCSIFSRAHSIRTSRNRQFCDATLTVRQVSTSRF